MERVQIGPQIAAARVARKLTQQQLAEATGFSLGAIASWELGRRHPRPGALAKLADALGVKVASFYAESPRAAA